MTLSSAGFMFKNRQIELFQKKHPKVWRKFTVLGWAHSHSYQWTREVWRLQVGRTSSRSLMSPSTTFSRTVHSVLCTDACHCEEFSLTSNSALQGSFGLSTSYPRAVCVLALSIAFSWPLTKAQWALKREAGPHPKHLNTFSKLIKGFLHILG